MTTVTAAVAPAAPAPASEGALSLSDAARLLSAARKREQQATPPALASAEPPAEQPEPPAAEPEIAPLEAGLEQLGDDQDATEAEPSAELLDLFGAEAAHLARLPEPAQRALVAREQERTQHLQQLQQGYEEAAAHLQVLQEIAPTLNQVMADRWSAIDWDALAQQDPQAYWAYKAQYDREVAATAAAQEAQEAQSRRERAQAIQRERGRLLQLAPEFGTPERARTAISQIKAFAQSIGIDGEVLSNLNGAETYALHLAAQAWAAQRGLSAKRLPAATPKATPPGAALTNRSQSARMAEADQRLSQTGSIDAAVELLRARRGR